MLELYFFIGLFLAIYNTLNPVGETTEQDRHFLSQNILFIARNRPLANDRC